MRIGIVGGGLSGISLRYFLRHKSEILEKENKIGGLCRTFEKNGFLYDIGGHILFSKDKDFTAFIKKVLGKNINYCRRNNKILFKDRYVKYPFENGLSELGKKDNYECLLGYIRNNYPAPKNFHEWIFHTFGEGIANKYMVPYNKKIWKFDLSRMGLGWVERVPKPPIEDVIKSAIGVVTEGYTHQLYFNYPKYGGIASLVKTLVKDEGSIHTRFNVTNIRKKNGSWVVSDGFEDKVYDKLVLTMPIGEAVGCLEKVPPRVKKAAAELKHNSVRIVLVGINNGSLSDKSAIYLPDNKALAHRLCYMSYFSKNNVPQGRSSLMAEISTRRGQKIYHASGVVLAEIVIKDLTRLGIIDRRDVVVTDVKDIEYAYIIYDRQYEQNIKIVKDYFGYIGIELLGRFAEFEYINMDEVIRRGMRLARRLNR